jgi:NADH-quinone oxidoreductase subunit I
MVNTTTPTRDTAMIERLREFFRTFLLFELVKGMALTGRYFFARKITGAIPRREDASIRTLPRDCTPRGAYPNGEERCIACKLCEGGLSGLGPSP